MSTFDRRDFLKASAVVGGYLLLNPRSISAETPPPDTVSSRNKLDTFDYEGVKLLPSRFQKQHQACRDFYLSISNDDTLCGFRKAANLPAPGKTLGGWAAGNTGGIFGQWLSGMARMYKSTGDTAIRDKALLLMTEWAKTIPADGNSRLGHYAFEKAVCGLIDLHLYAKSPEALALLEKICTYGLAHMDHANVAAGPVALGGGQGGGNSGRPSEWYTLAENIYRAYQATGNPLFKSFGDLWLYPAYWNKFANTSDPNNAQAVHAYSHVNTYSSCAMAYAVTGDQKYLTILKNAYDFLQNHQCFATGGFGPSEFIVTSDGGLGRSLETRTDSFETGCGSWAAFKMGRYLISFTGESRYGDWMERILYNGIGSALPVSEGGKNFYYSDYRVDGGMKVYNWEAWTCCSGSYIQAVADFYNILYFKDAPGTQNPGLYINLFVPSEVTWKHPEGDVKLTQETNYPVAETSTLTVALAKATTFPLRIRIPAWCSNASIKINGEAANVECKPGMWASLQRAWNDKDKVEITIPLSFRMQPVDKQHPDVVAVVRGPVVMALEAAYHNPNLQLPATDEELNKWLAPDPGTGGASARGVQSAITGVPGAFHMTVPDKGRVTSLFRPFYTIEELFPYKIYFDRKKLPIAYW